MGSPTVPHARCGGGAQASIPGRRRSTAVPPAEQAAHTARVNARGPSTTSRWCGPELAREWHPTRNGTLTPESLTPWSHRPVWWQCAQGHEWCAPPVARRAEDTCAMCAGKRFSVENNLARPSPKLAAQWHPSRNTDRTAASVTARSSHRAWWRCDDCGHEWQSSVNNRARGAACPVCALTARVLR